MKLFAYHSLHYLSVVQFHNGFLIFQIPGNYITIKILKKHFEIEPYLRNVKNDKQRILLTKLRISDHELAIETGRYTNINREERCFSKITGTLINQ